MSGPVMREADPRSDEALLRVALVVLAAYLVATTLPMARWCRAESVYWPLLAHLGTLGMVLGGLRLGAIRGWIPLALGPFLYIEIRWIIAGVGIAHGDATVAGWEHVLFASDPSRTLATAFPSRVLSEMLHLCYLSYYAIVYVVPALLWRRRDASFAFAVLTIVLVYAMCFVAFIAFPVEGPRFLYGPAPAPDGPIRDFARLVLERGSSRGTAFPSAHVAASLAAGLCALRYLRRVGTLVLLVVAGMAAGAVYGGYHYGVDVVAGIVTALASYAIARMAERAIAAALAR